MDNSMYQNNHQLKERLASIATTSDIKFNWLDISHDFVQSCKELRLGELHHDSSFGLYEAMSAIEMMDPKMDAGLLCNRGGRRALNFDQALEAGTLKVDDIRDKEIIGIVDTTFSCIVSWLEGHSLAQTVFTNLYLHKPFEIKDRTLKVFSISIYKIVDCIRDYIQSAGVFEEEDFQPMSYCYALCPNVSESRVHGMLREVEDELFRRTRKPAENNKHDSTNNPDIEMAVYARMKFTHLLYVALLLLGHAHDKRDRREETYTEIVRTLNQCSEFLATVRKSTHHSIKLNNRTGYSSDDAVMIGFEPLINQRLLPPTFPRYTKIKPCTEAYLYIEQLLGRLRTVCEILLCSHLHPAIDYFINFSHSNSCVLSRSILQLLYLGGSPMVRSGSPTMTVFGFTPFVDTLREACRNFIGAPPLPNKCQNNHNSNNNTAKEYVNTFFGHCVRPFTTIIQTYGHNHARQRDKLAHVLEDLGALQDEAERVDVFLHNQYLSLKIGRPHLACFGSWVLFHTLQVMKNYLLSGFQLELYSVYEYYYIYWYLYECLYGWMTSALTRAENYLLWTEAETTKNYKNKKSKTKKKKSSERVYDKQIFYYQALQNMCGGYFKGLLGLQCDGKIKFPCSQFSREPIRFEHRFAPFRSLITPPPITYGEFKDMTKTLHNSGLRDAQCLYTAAAEHFRQAKCLLENLTAGNKDVHNFIRIAKWNYVVFNILAGGHRKGSDESPDLDFSMSAMFPFIKFPLKPDLPK